MIQSMKQAGTAGLLLALAVGSVQPAAAARVPDFTQIVKDNRDAVVNVSTTQKIDTRASGLPPGLLEQLPPDHPLRRFFKRFGGGQGGQRERTSRSAPAPPAMSCPAGS